ncbi:MAG: phosphoribosylanthranilate isomerase [Deltaproteobacteria bacterium]|nr:phosphoribosylanthranilate isomerase [Deltaproteobacteria bacterium]
MVRVKICGITNYDDASMAVGCGADALGFIFAASPRRISPEKARDIIRNLPPFVSSVGVFVNEDYKTIQRITDFCCLDNIQLHGDEPPELCGKFLPGCIKAFRVKDDSSIESIKPYKGKCRAILLDTYSKDKEGGTGISFDWELALKAKKFDIPIILSGGLGPDNIETAISLVEPYAVDVNSGIEKSPGKKDPELMKKLMDLVMNINTKGQFCGCI